MILTVDKLDQIQTRFTEIVEVNFEYADLSSCNYKNIPYAHADRLVQTDWFKQCPDSEIKARLLDKMRWHQLAQLALKYNRMGIMCRTKEDSTQALKYYNKSFEVLERLYW